MQRNDTMIDRIDRIGSSHTYQVQKLNKKVQSNTEAFSMKNARQEKTVGDTEKEDLIIEALLRKSQEPDGGVKVELSKAGTQTVEKEHSVRDEGTSGVIWERLWNLWKDIKAAFVKFFNGGVERIKEEDITVVDRSEVSEEEDAAADASKTQEETFRELLAELYENGEKKLAKKSDLLTTYNKRGSLVQMDAGDKNRILHMHPNQIDKTF